MRSLAKHYSGLYGKYPLRMAALSTTTLGFCGDYLCQLIENRNNNNNFKWNYLRSIRFGFVGLCLGPQLAMWYKFLNIKFPISNSNKLKSGFKQMFVDQSIFAPWAICFVFSLNTIIEGGNINNIKQRLNNQWLKAYKTNLKVWPITQFINFSIVPLEFRVIIVNIVSLWFNGYMSYMSHEKIKNI